MKNNLDHARVLLEKAGNDLKLAGIGLQHDAPTDTIAFHLQQAAEKILKAILASREIIYPKTHDLDDLFDLVPSDLAEIHSFRESVWLVGICGGHEVRTCRISRKRRDATSPQHRPKLM